MTDLLRERVERAIGHLYELEHEIGRGGMSVVYRARDIRLDRPVALKVLPPELAYDPGVRTRFTREAQTAARLSHAHIVPIYDVGEADGLAYLVMAFVTGGSLASLEAREPRQPVHEVRRILAEVADALAHAHLHGVVHRDIKPDNILLEGQSGRALVTDFGIARAVEAGAGLTATGVAVGTPTYMSPEQATGEREIDGRSDVYSLGVVGYQMLTGRVPFTAGNSMALLLKHVTERPRPIAELRADAPRALRDAVERAMTKSPDDRWPTAAAMRDVLLSDGAPVASWRNEQREAVRYQSPRPDDSRAQRAVSPRRGTAAAVRTPAAPPRALDVTISGSRGKEIVLEPAHLAVLTDDQRADLRLWGGRITLHDRIRFLRRYAWLTFALTFAAGASLAGVPDVPPLVLAPLVPLYMYRQLFRRVRSIRERGVRARRVLFMPLARKVLPAQTPVPTRHQLEKLAPRAVLDGPNGSAIQRAAVDRAAILELVAKLPEADRALLPDVEPTANALVDRVAQLAQELLRLDEGLDPALADDLRAREADAERDAESASGQRRLGMLRRQRATLDELFERRATLQRQLDDAGLALGNLRLDLVRLRSSGIASALGAVSTATQEARALTRDISVAIEAAAELRKL